MPSSVTSLSSTSLEMESSTSSRTGGLEAAPLQFPLQRLHQVLGDVLVHLEVTGAGDPEHMVLQDVQAREQLGEVRGDHVFQRHEPVLGHGEEPWAAVAAP